MYRIWVKVCNGDYDGTNDNVRLHFRGRWRTCSTDWINRVKSLENPSRSVVFNSDVLGDCKSFQFEDKLTVSIEIWRAGWNIQYDGS